MLKQNDEHPYFQQWPSAINNRSSRLLSRTLNSSNVIRNTRPSNLLSLYPSQLSPVKLMASTRDQFGRPDYCQMRKNKLKNYFLRKEKSVEPPRLIKTNSEESIQKIRQFTRENDLSEDQKRTLQQALLQNEKITDIFKVYPSTQKHSPRSRITFKQSETCRQPSYRDNHDTHILSQLYKQRPLEARKNSCKSKASSINMQSEKCVQESDSRDSVESEQEDDSETQQQQELKNAFKSAIVDIKTHIFPRQHEKKKSASFFSYIKHQDRIKDLAENFDVDDNQNPAYFFAQNQTLFPKRFDVSNCSIQKNRLDFSNLLIGDAYIQIVANYLTSKTYKDVKQIILCQNALTHRGLEILLGCMPLSLRELNLKSNLIAREGAKLLGANLTDKLFNLKDLNLQDNHLGDSGAQCILVALTKNSILKRLNLSDNALTDRTSTSMYNFVRLNQTIEVLLLHWNKLGTAFGVQLARALSVNRSVRVLDCSYNTLGGGGGACVQEWCAMLSNPGVKMNHLDLSFNSFSEAQLRRLDVALRSNTSIYGLHIEGNVSQAYVDPNGFIRFDWGEDKSQQQKMYKIDGVNYLPLNKANDERADCCWICQGWMQVKFHYTPGRSGLDVQPPLFLHLDFMDYQPLIMSSGAEIQSQNAASQVTKKTQNWDITTGEIIYQLKELETGEKRITMASIQEAYSNNRPEDKQVSEAADEVDLNYHATYKMCPPNRKINYFFSDASLVTQFIAQDYSAVAAQPVKGRVMNYTDGTKMELSDMPLMNYVVTKQEYILDDKNGYKPLIGVYPRAQERKYALKKLQQQQLKKKTNLIMWCRDNSIFKDFQGDTPQHLDACFEFDWNCSKIQRFIRNDYDRQKMKEYLREHYLLLKDIYKYTSFIHRFYASSSLQIQTFQIYCLPFSLFTRLINQIGVLDGELLKGTDIEIQLVSIKNNLEKQLIYNPEKALIRYQFVEMFFRMANDKYVRTGQSKSYADAFDKLMRMDVKPKFAYFDLMQVWREQRLWNKECDQLLRFKQPFLNKLYDYVTEITQRRWYFRLKWISLREFKDFLVRVEMLPDVISEKDAMAIYSLSMQTQIDEITQDRHIRMQLNEFLECLSRLAEKISPCPMGQQFDKWDMVSRQLLPLSVKLETLITYIFWRLRNAEFDQFADRFSQEDPTQSMPRVANKGKPDKTQWDALEVGQLRILDQVLHTNDPLNKRILSVVGVLAFMEVFKQPYILPNYLQFFQEQAPPPPALVAPPPPAPPVKKAKVKRPQAKGKVIKFQDES